MDYKIVGNLPRNWQDWSCHLWEGTRYQGGHRDSWGHAVSPSGRYARRVDVYAGDVPEVHVGPASRADFDCREHAESYGFHTAVLGATIEG